MVPRQPTFIYSCDTSQTSFMPPRRIRSVACHCLSCGFLLGIGIRAGRRAASRPRTRRVRSFGPGVPSRVAHDPRPRHFARIVRPCPSGNPSQGHGSRPQSSRNGPYGGAGRRRPGTRSSKTARTAHRARPPAARMRGGVHIRRPDLTGGARSTKPTPPTNRQYRRQSVDKRKSGESRT